MWNVAVSGETEFPEDRHSSLELDLARAVLQLAVLGGMPDTYWYTDSRIELARRTLGLMPHEARDWAVDSVE